jgi:phospholipid/cholesterol/gamma-HCH transport system substrate-binding protein
MKNSLETRLGIFAALAVIATVLILETVGGIELFRPGYHLHTLFNNTQDLKVGDRVKMAGVEVGRVEKISLDETNNKVRVTMKLREKVIVRTDSIASVKFTGLLGQNYVEVTFGSAGAPRALDGAELNPPPPEDEPPDLNAIMQKINKVASGVERLTGSFTGDKIDNLLGPLTDFLTANKGPLTTTISNVQAISTQIRQGEGTVGKLIYDDALYKTALSTVSNLQDTATEIKRTVADARQVVAQVNSGQGSLGKMLKDDTLYRQATTAMTNVNEILQKINSGQGSVGKLINDQDLYKNAKLTLQKLDKATEGLEDQGPLSVLGIAIQSLF